MCQLTHVDIVPEMESPPWLPFKRRPATSEGGWGLLAGARLIYRLQAAGCQHSSWESP